METGQYEKFKDKARELGTGESKKAFESKLWKISKQKAQEGKEVTLSPS